MSARRIFLLALGIVALGVYLLARRRAQESGRTLLEVLPEVPAEAERVLEESVDRLKSALEAAREAAAQKQKEISSIVEEMGPLGTDTSS